MAAAASDASQGAVKKSHALTCALELAAPFGDTEKQVVGAILDLLYKIKLQPDAAENWIVRLGGGKFACGLYRAVVGTDNPRIVPTVDRDNVRRICRDNSQVVL